VNGVDWQIIAVIAVPIVSLVASLFAYLQARKADKSATFTKHIELGVTELVDQLQEEREVMREQIADCRGDCARLERSIEQLTRKVSTLKTIIDNKDAEIIRLSRQAGEF
jgi:septal ring factor EnvC (AmiA/AmiB activator)